VCLSSHAPRTAGRVRLGGSAHPVDGSPRFSSSKTGEALLRGLITRNGGEKIDPSVLE